jgi:hypothetical protein
MTVRAHPGAQARGQGDRPQVGQRASQDADTVTVHERHGDHDQPRHQRGDRRGALPAPVRDGRYASKTGTIMIVSRSASAYTTKMPAKAPTGLRPRSSNAIVHSASARA